MFSYTYYSGSDDVYNKQLPRLLKLFNTHDDKKWTYPYHLHKECLEIVYIKEGIIHYKIDMHSLTAKKGDLIILNPGTLHTMAVDSSIPAYMWVLHADNFQIPGLENNYLSKNNFEILPLNEHANFADALFREFVYLYINKKENQNNVCQQMLYTFLILIYNLQLESKMEANSDYPDYAREIMQFLNDHFTEPLSLDEIASHFFLSKSRMAHIFTEYFGVSPINYLIDRRVCEAKWLLTSSDLSIEQISNVVGYNDVSYFRKLFKKRTSFYPSDFRNQYSDPTAERDRIYADKRKYRI